MLLKLDSGGWPRFRCRDEGGTTELVIEERSATPFSKIEPPRSLELFGRAAGGVALSADEG